MAPPPKLGRGLGATLPARLPRPGAAKLGRGLGATLPARPLCPWAEKLWRGLGAALPARLPCVVTSGLGTITAGTAPL